MTYYNRRRFMQTTAAGFLGASAAMSGLGQRRAYAADTGGYKAMVGIFLKGGVDMFDAILPRDQASYDQYAQVRPNLINSHTDGSRSRDNLLSLAPTNAANFEGREFGLVPELASLKDMFDTGEMAIVGGVGPLRQHVDRPQFSSGLADVPARLFSHNDQQSTWMALAAEGARAGWGGGMMREIEASARSNRPEFSLITAGSNDVFLSGADDTAFKAPFDPSGSNLSIYSNAQLTRGGYGADALAIMDRHLRDPGAQAGNVFARDFAQGQSNGVINVEQFRNAVAGQGALTTVFPDTGLGRQLSTVARTIQARGAIGNSRQIFYADMGGFDTHNNQAVTMPNLLTSISDAVTAFRNAMVEMGVWDDVALFTMSDFGRTLVDNGAGTDHGWGNHQLVFGGQVQGGNIFGEIAESDPTSDRFLTSRGRLIPSVSVDQYAATLGSWFGLDNGEIDRVLPNLNRFDTRDLGFMA